MASFEPAWASAGAPAPAGTPAAAAPASYGTAGGSPEPANAKLVQGLLSGVNLCLAVLMACSGVLAVANNTTFSADIFVAIYMILFGILLFMYELMYFKTMDAVVLPLRKNFGFLFGVKGKAFFIIFIAFLNFGLNSAAEPAKSLGLATGICFLIDGIVHVAIMLKWPEYIQSSVPSVNGYNAPR